jgi:hypothetical protein
MGQELKNRVFAHLDLEESDYFGLQFTDHMQVHHWLDSAKRVRKQIPFGPPYTLRFRVKFFSNEPANLRDELTRQVFFTDIDFSSASIHFMTQQLDSGISSSCRSAKTFKQACWSVPWMWQSNWRQ